MTAIGKIFDASAMDGPGPEAWPWPADQASQDCWRAWARTLSAWFATQGLDAKDALVILPVGAVLAPARAGWLAEVGGWLPRIDTIASVAQASAWLWEPPRREGNDDGEDALPALTLDPVIDRLQAARSLGRQAWGKQWAQRDRRGFEFALDQVVDAAHAWLRRLQAIAPDERAGYAEHARGHLAGTGGGGTGPGGRERLLLGWALEWAVSAAEQGQATDALFAMRPAALVVTTAGHAVSPGTEAHLTLGVMRHLAKQGVPVKWLSAVPMPAIAVDPYSGLATPSLCTCLDAEDEACQAAAQVLSAVVAARAAGENQLPVALIALDRGLVRRVRAMLEGTGLQVADETGWRLSTTRAAAVLSRVMQASHPHASTDDLLDWLKSGWVDWRDLPQGDLFETATLDNAENLAEAIGRLEAWCRRHAMLGAWSLQPDADIRAEPSRPPGGLPQVVPEGRQAMPAQAVRLWQWARQVSTPMRTLWAGRRARLTDWLLSLRDVLAASGSLQALKQDAAGGLALQALRFDEGTQASDVEQAWQGLAGGTLLDGRAFMRWVGHVLEGTTFRPEAPAGTIDVVITPMARAVLRGFHAIVLPGADERQLGALPSQTGWLGTRLREAMDLATPQSQRAAQWDAFELLMNRPGMVCLHRQAQGSEPLEASPWIEKWSSQQGVAIAGRADARVPIAVPHAPERMPMPHLASHPWALPMHVTATSYEALRQCPYRFFATGVLGLREQDELDEGLDRSDFGIWLHEVLRRFHVQRQTQRAIQTPGQDVAALLDVARQVIHEKGFDRDSQRPYFLPFQADLDRLAEGYVHWLHAHEAAGWSVERTEAELERHIEAAPGLKVRLHGQLDRIDAGHADGQRQRFVLDYKTGSLSTLKAKVAQPLEDTQLAFYAALSESDEPVAAAYLHLEARSVSQVTHAQVEDSAAALLTGLADDWRRLHGGAAMPAMGEGSACAYCQARGLCRKDHWTPVEDLPTPADGQDEEARR